MTKLNITKGEWLVFNTDAGLYWVDNDLVENICDFYHKVDECRFHIKENAKDNAELVSQAGSVYNETGLTPRELLDLARELRIVVSTAKHALEYYDEKNECDMGSPVMIKEILEKTEQIK